jgi:hypothetical protein
VQHRERLMTAVEQTCKAVGALDGLYDCSGSAAALAALAAT